MRERLKFYNDNRQVSEVALTESLFCGIFFRNWGVRMGAYYSLRSGLYFGAWTSQDSESTQWRAGGVWLKNMNRRMKFLNIRN